MFSASEKRRNFQWSGGQMDSERLLQSSSSDTSASHLVCSGIQLKFNQTISRHIGTSSHPNVHELKRTFKCSNEWMEAEGFFLYLCSISSSVWGRGRRGGSLNLKTLQTPAPGTQNSWCDTVYLRLEAECGPQSQSAPMSEEWVGCYFDGVSLSHR